MGLAIAHYCGRGRGPAASGQIVTLRCDVDCTVVAVASTKDEYQALLAVGWSIVYAGEASLANIAEVACPAHSGVAPTAPVQQELTL